jgi:hypothetical protein
MWEGNTVVLKAKPPAERSEHVQRSALKHPFPRAQAQPLLLLNGCDVRVKPILPWFHDNYMVRCHVAMYDVSRHCFQARTIIQKCSSNEAGTRRTRLLQWCDGCPLFKVG